MNKSTMNDLYYGRIIPWERGGCLDPEFIAANRKITEAKEYFKGIMNEDAYKRLEVLEDLYSDTSDMESVDAFSYGFRLATLLLIEVFSAGIPISEK